MNPNDCPRQCDCRHPSECLFAAPEAERPNFAVVWIVGAVVVAVVALVLFVVLL